MLGFSFPKILLLIIIIFLVWNFFKLLEEKIKKNNQKESKSDNNNKIYDEALTECSVCGTFYSKNFLSKCNRSKCPRNN